MLFLKAELVKGVGHGERFVVVHGQRFVHLILVLSRPKRLLDRHFFIWHFHREFANKTFSSVILPRSFSSLKCKFSFSLWTKFLLWGCDRFLSFGCSFFKLFILYSNSFLNVFWNLIWEKNYFLSFRKLNFYKLSNIKIRNLWENIFDHFDSEFICLTISNSALRIVKNVKFFFPSWNLFIVYDLIWKPFRKIMNFQSGLK